MRVSPSLVVDARDAEVLRARVSDPAQPAAGRRALIILLSGAGHDPAAVASWLPCSKQTVMAWRERYRTMGLDGLRDAPRSGRPITISAATVVLGTLRPPDPAGVRWSTRTLGVELGISNVAVGNVWREWGIRPELGGRVSLRTEPALDVDVLAVLGLHVDPPLYLAAVAVVDRDAAAGTVAARTGASRRGLGDVLDGVLGTAGSGSGDPAALEGFLVGLDRAWERPETTPTSSARIVLIAAGDVGATQLRLHDHGGVALHTVTAVASWERIVRVGCLLAGAGQGGAASVEALRTALTEHRGGPFTWTRPRL